MGGVIRGRERVFFRAGQIEEVGGHEVAVFAGHGLPLHRLQQVALRQQPQPLAQHRLGRLEGLGQLVELRRRHRLEPGRSRLASARDVALPDAAECVVPLVVGGGGELLGQRGPPFLECGGPFLDRHALDLGRILFRQRLDALHLGQQAPDLLEQAVEVIRKRVDQYGVSEPVITPQGKDRILVQIAGLDTKQTEEAKSQLQRVAKLEFSIVDEGGAARVARIKAGEEIMDPSLVILPMTTGKEKKETTEILVKRRPALTGDTVTRAFAFFDQHGYGVSLELNSEGAAIFDEVARQNKGRQMAIILDGEVISAPVLQSDHFGGRAQITGHFTDKEARDLASALENPLRVLVQIEETRSVSPTLGADSIKSGVLAGFSGLVLAFMVLYYRKAGLLGP